MRVYFEPQVAALCGQHLLNNLLQGPYFTVGQLAQVAQDLDAKERALGLTERAGSQNVDEAGNFSIQVLQACLETMGNSLAQEDAVVRMAIDKAIASSDADFAPGFVFNFESHWFAVRKLGDGKFYRLDSVQKRPTLVGEVYLSALIAQLRGEGYSVYSTVGTRLPKAEYNPADEHWIELEEQQQTAAGKPSLVPFQGKGRSLRGDDDNDQPINDDDDDDDPELKHAIELSKRDFVKTAKVMTHELTPEPTADCDPAGYVTVQLQLPSGKKVRRRFIINAHANEIQIWASTLDEVKALGREFNLFQPGVGPVDVSLVQAVDAFHPNVTLRVVT
jgi:hypothetical protein